MPITHICSLHCDGCSAYSNYTLKYNVSIEQVEAWLSMWSKRINPKTFRMLGGEPFLHPQLPEIFLAVRRFFPNTHIAMCTNGMNLDKHPMMPRLLSLPNTSLHISIHSKEEKYVEKVKVAINTMNSWAKNHGVKISSGDNVSKWNRFYKGIGAEMMPYEDKDVKKSWEVCHSKHCINLVEGRLWKCPQVGNLGLVADKFNLHEKEAWKPYLAYKGIGLEATEDELVKFLSKGPEAVCGMCPANIENYEKDIYNVNFVQKGVHRMERPKPAPVQIAQAE